jgi:hypothetical protein
MILPRKLIAGCVAVLALVLACVAIFEALPGYNSIIDHTIQNSRQIEKAFFEASAYVDGFAQSHGRLPTDTEFSEWAALQPESAHSARYFHFIASPTKFPTEIIDKFGKPTDGGYIFEYWGGEWFEYYASWVRKNTLNLDLSSFYLLGSPIADGIAMLIISLLLGIITKIIWPPSERMNKAR